MLERTEILQQVTPNFSLGEALLNLNALNSTDRMCFYSSHIILHDWDTLGHTYSQMDS